MSDLAIFCRQVRARSLDHQKAFVLLYKEQIWSQVVAILRQELDSLVRVIYLLSISDIPYRNALITAAVEGRRWTIKGTKKPITDKQMVDLANQLHGWAESVYRFACGFIHLSAFHDYEQRDPLDMIPESEKNAIIQHMRRYHHCPHEREPKLKDLFPCLPQVLKKIADNLECYVKDLEANELTSLIDL